MESQNEEKLEAIRAAARRSAAERAQADQVAASSSRAGNSKPSKVKVQDLVFIPLALAVVLWLWSHYTKEPEQAAQAGPDQYEQMVHAGHTSVAKAALLHLNAEGWAISDIDDIQARPSGGDGLYIITVAYAGNTVRLTAKDICKPGPFDFEIMANPRCYTWH